MKNKKYIVSFPRLGNYVYPIYNMLDRLIDKDIAEILMPKPMSKDTIDLGSLASPDFVCLPFKYNMGNFIESLKQGANFLLQAGGGCRYGYYAEVQEQILRDMGYDFTYVSLLEPEGINVKKIYNKFKLLNPTLKFSKFVNELLIAIKSINILDEVETYIRDNYMYELKKGEFDKIHKEFLESISNIHSILELKKVKIETFKKINKVKFIEEKEKILKVGIVGELYTSMEPFSTFFLEKELASLGVKVKRYTTVTYLLFKKGRALRKHIKYANKYIDYALGADGTESVAHTLELIENGYDGIIHIKPFGCTPEVNAMPILQKISNEYEVPIMYLTFDSQTSQTGIKTRLEAFYDMLVMKKEASLLNKGKHSKELLDKENGKDNLCYKKHKFGYEH